LASDLIALYTCEVTFQSRYRVNLWHSSTCHWSDSVVVDWLKIRKPSGRCPSVSIRLQEDSSPNKLTMGRNLPLVKPCESPLWSTLSKAHNRTTFRLRDDVHGFGGRPPALLAIVCRRSQQPRKATAIPPAGENKSDGLASPHKLEELKCNQLRQCVQSRKN
jgi:hypothetical protein